MYSVRRKADRQKMADLLVNAAIAAGAKAEAAAVSYEPRAIDVNIRAPGGAYVNVRFDGSSSQPDVFVYCWNIELDSDSCFSDAWGWNVVNRFHFGKAQRVSYGFDEMLDRVLKDIALCVSGEAYSEERKLASIAKNGTAAERNARFAEWIATLDKTPA